jgi:hypothetical protein
MVLECLLQVPMYLLEALELLLVAVDQSPQEAVAHHCLVAPMDLLHWEKIQEAVAHHHLVALVDLLHWETLSYLHLENQAHTQKLLVHHNLVHIQQPQSIHNTH